MNELRASFVPIGTVTSQFEDEIGLDGTRPTAAERRSTRPAGPSPRQRITATARAAVNARTGSADDVTGEVRGDLPGLAAARPHRLSAVPGQGRDGDAFDRDEAASVEESRSNGEGVASGERGDPGEAPGAAGGEGEQPRAGRGPLVLTDGPCDAPVIDPDATGNDDPTRSAFFVNRFRPPVRSGAFYADDPRLGEYDGGGFVQDNHPAPASVHAAVVRELAERLGTAPHADDVRFVCHVWLVGALRHDDGGDDLDGFVPLPWEVIARDVPGADLDGLMYGGVVEMTPHDRKGGRCRAYAVTPDFGAVLDSALATAAPGEAYVNVFTGKARRGRKPGNRKRDDNRNPVSRTVSLAMDAVPLGILNLPAVETHLAGLRAAVDTACSDDTRSRAAARRRNDLLCLSWIKSRGLTATDVPGVYTYPHAWRVQSAGRIMPLESGGAQSMSRAGKAAMYSGVADVRNYDLRASQPRILADEFARWGIACEWLAGYLADSSAKETHADRVGVSVDTWKAGVLAAIMGGAAGVPKRFERKAVTRFVRGEEVTTYRPVCAAMRTLEAEVGPERAAELWPVLHAALVPLLRAVRDWHGLLAEWAETTATSGRDGKGITNAVEVRLCLSDLSARELPRKVAAHVLQGREALYVHTLCTLGRGYGFRVVCHEHDGIVTLGPVPPAAMDEAARAARMPYAEMVLKPFAS